MWFVRALTASARNQGMSVYSPLIKGLHLLTKVVPHGVLLGVCAEDEVVGENV